MNPIDATLNVLESTVPGQRIHYQEPFPLVFQCRSREMGLEETVDWIAVHRDELLARSSRHGAILFRGFPLASAEDFDRFVTAFGLPNFPYDESLSNAVRVNRTPRVFTANEAPPNVTIFLHHEMAQTPISPSRLFFFCEHPADEGGATPICRSDVLWDRLAARCDRFARECAEKGLRYSNVMPSASDAASGMGRSWQHTLRASDRQEAEARLHGLGYHWQWLDDGCLRATTPVLPAVRHLPGGRTSFFNQMIAAYHGWKDDRNDPSKSITFGDGTPLDHEGVTVAAALADELTFDIPWQRGDVALLDNYVVMHGRRTFAGMRKVLAALIAAESATDR